MSLLSDYQRAALEVMGIPVWVSQSEQHATSPQETVTDTVPATPKSVSPADRAAKLAALRAQVSSANTSPDTTENASVSDAPTAPPTRALSAQEVKAAGKLLSDIQLAARTVSFTENTLAFEVGEQLGTTPDRITLPCPPEVLTAKQKRALWKAISQA